MAGKEDKFSGVLDVAPVAQSEEDLRFLADGIKQLTERHGEDYEALRKKMENMYKLDQWEKAVNGGIGIHLPSALERFDMIKEAGQQWFRSYCSIVSKRINEPYDEQDEACMNSVRARILEFYLIGDRSIGISMKLGVPLEALTLGLLAPVIRY
jgi:coproporphyrinogen III oxidase